MSETTGSTNPFQSTPEQQYEHLRVGFGPRFLAWVIDALAAGLFAALLAALFLNFDLSMSQFMTEQLHAITEIYELLGISQSLTDMIINLIPALTLGGMIAGIMYPLIEGLTGASPGKRIIKIIVAHPDGKAADTSLWLRRFVVKNLGAILQIFVLVQSLNFIDTIGDFFSFVIFIGCFFVLGQSRLALHDRIASTAVYYKEDVRS